MSDEKKTVLSMRHINKTFPGVKALSDAQLTLREGEIHALMGENGAGKSTLGNVIMGNSQYKVDRGSIFFEDEDITSARTDERAQKGLFLSFQSPIEIPGVSISQFIRTAMETKEKIRLKTFRDKLKTVTKTLGINEQWINRELNVGFSGGERKKIEMLQLLMLNPKLAILDETDSGLDVDAVKTVSRGIQTFQQDDQKSLLIITHNSKILEYLHIDYVHILINGKIIKTGDASLIKIINEQGYEPLITGQGE
ncbi:Fe-S cluster assembly ATPase SufC [Megamonas sp.]|uniref:Fe-S cluster assembly ATPase SufC n=1 Tax=Megamonas sp. TaxID=2049033 RepID=UPI002584018E|nr:Fe-S cluster assembly ATPase SufC [Megamonas sp.]